MHPGTNTTDADSYGWNPTFSYDPVINPTDIELALGLFGGVDPYATGRVGYVTFTYNGGNVTISLANTLNHQGTMDKDGIVQSNISSTVNVEVPEPATLLVFALGGVITRMSLGKSASKTRKD